MQGPQWTHADPEMLVVSGIDYLCVEKRRGAYLRFDSKERQHGCACVQRSPFG